MASEILQKPMDTYAGVGDMVIYDGTNVDAVQAMAESTVGGTFEIVLDDVFVNGELISVGDGVCVSDDETPVAHAKIPRQTLINDQWQIDALLYDGNLEEIRTFVGKQQFEYRGGAVYIEGMLLEDTDYVYKNGGKLVRGQKLTTARRDSDYEPSE